MQRIVVLNPKGGSGKTTIAINLASYYALNGEQPALLTSIRRLPRRAGRANARSRRLPFT